MLLNIVTAADVAGGVIFIVTSSLSLMWMTSWGLVTTDNK